MARVCRSVLLWGWFFVLSMAPAWSQTVSFVDETGAPVASYLEGSRVWVRVEDPGAGSPYGIDTVWVYLSSSVDSEGFEISETGADTGVYTGSLPLSYQGTGTPGALDTGTSGPPFTRDSLTVSYTTLTDTAGLVGSTVQLLDSFGRPATTWLPGGGGRIRVVSPIRNSPFQIDSTLVAVTAAGSGDQESVTLTETGYNTGVFEADLATTSQGYAAPGDGTLYLPLADTLQARHDDADGPTFATATATSVASLTDFLDGDGKPTAFVMESSRARIQVVDPQANFTTQVQVSSLLTGDSETVELTETGPGTFQGSVELMLSPGGGQPGNGLLETSEATGPPHAFDTLTATHADAGSGSSATATTFGSRTWFLDAYGEVTTVYAAGTIAYIRVEDQNANDPTRFDRVLVQVLSLTSEDTETLELLEVEKAGGVFEGAIILQSSWSPSGDGRLRAEMGERIEARHTDALGATASGAQAHIVYAEIGFIDEEGRPTAELLEKGLARVRLISPARNSDSSTAETVSVEVSSRYTGDQVMVTLTETGLNSGVFEGAVRLDFSPGDDTLHTSNSGAPDYLGDEVTASYGPEIEATAVTASSRVVFIDGFGRETTTFPLGGPVRIRVFDYTAGVPQSIDFLTVHVHVPQNTEGERVTLTETGYDTGVYEGAMASTQGGGSIADNVLQGQVGMTVEAHRESSTRPYFVVARAAFGGPAVLFVDAAGQPATVYLEGARAYVRVLAPLHNGTSLTIQLSTELSGDLETLELQAVAYGVFAGSIDTELAAGGVGGNGVIELGQVEGPPHEFDVLTATYSDTLGNPPSSARAGFTGSRTWFVNAFGAVTDSYPIGARIHVRVEDHHQTNPSQFDRLLVQVRSLATGDTETLELLETGKTSNVYEGSLDQRDYPVAIGGDGVLQVELGSRIEAERTDTLGWSASKAEALIDYIGIDILDEEGRPTAVLLEEGTARVRVVRHSNYDDPSYIDTLGIEVKSRYAGDREFLNLTETGPDTGIYEGTIALSLAATAQNDGLLQTSNSGAPEYRGDEVTASYGPELQATAVTSSSRVVFIDGFGRETTSFPLGGQVRVRVIDYTAGAPYSIDPLAVSLTVPATGDVASPVLLETGYDTGIYEGSILSTASANSVGDSLLQGQVGAVIEARRDSSSRPYPVTALASFTGQSVLFVDAAGQPAAVYLEGARAYVRVLAPLHYGGSLSVNLSTELSGDLETLELQSTTPGVFEGSIDTELEAGGIGGNGVIELSQVQGPPHEFDSLTATYSDTLGNPPSSARVGFTGSRTWFIDAYGAVTDSYPIGGRVHVRVEDHHQTNPSQFDRLLVQVRSLATGDTETLELLETGKTSNVYEGSLETRDYSVAIGGDGVLQVSIQTIIEAERTDSLGWSASKAEALMDYIGIDIVDEGGRPTTVLLEEGTARVRVVRHSDYDDPNNADTLGIEVKSRYAGDREFLNLTETGPDTGVYEGTIALSLAATAQNDSLLQTSNSGAPEYRGDEVTASYGPELQATAVTSSSRVVFIDGFGRETTTFPLGGAVGVRVIDYTAGADYTIDPLAVTVSVPETGDSESLALLETGFDTGIFEGSLLSTTNSSATGDSLLRGQVGATIEARRDSSSRPYPVTALASFTGHSVLFVDAAGQPASVYLEGARAYVRVLAPLHDGGSLSVNLATDLSGDLETLELQAGAPGVFEGSIDTALEAGGIGGNGILELSQVQGPPHEFDSLTATYSDTLGNPPASARVGFTGSRTWFIDAYGAVTDSYPIGGRVHVRVEDHHQTNPSQFDRLLVQVRSLATGDTETLELLETGKTSHVYEGSLETRDYSVAIGGDGVLQVSMQTIIEAERTDSLGWSASKAEALIDYIGIDIVDEAGRPTSVLLEEGTARVRVVRHSDYDDPSYIDTLGIEVKSRYAGDREFLDLTETGPDTGIYEGSIALSLDATAQNDGLLQTSNSGAPEYRGDEVTASYGPELQATAVTSSSRVVFIDGFGRETTTFPLGGAVGVRVIDHTAGSSLSIDPLAVTVSVPETGDSESVTLMETGYDTGIFEGSLPSTENANTSGDNLLRGQVGATIEARRDSATRPYPVTAQASFTGTSLLFVDAAGQPVSVYLEGARAYVRLLAPLATGSSLTVNLETELSGDLESLELQATAPGVFEGSIDTVLEAGGIGGNGILELSQVQGPPHEYDTLTASYDDTLSYSIATARVGFTGSRTWFIDAYGAVTETYPSGSRVYVRVEDHSQNNPTSFDRLTVQVRSLSTLDAETIELMETTKTSHVYEGSLDLDEAPSSSGTDGVLQAEMGTLIEAERTPLLGWGSSKAQARIAYVGIDIIDEQGRPTTVLLEEGTARVRVVRISQYDDPSTPDRMGIEVESRYAGDREFLDLTETGPDTGIYEGTIALSLAAMEPNDGTLQTSNSGAPAYLGDEVTASYGPELHATAVTSASRVVFIDGFGRETTTFPLGGAVRVRLVDYTANTPTLIDQTSLTATVPQTGDFQEIDLVETGYDTGVFEGAVPSAAGAPAPYDGTLQGQIGATVDAERASITRPYPVVARATFAGSSVLFVDAAGQPASVYLEGARVYVRVLAPLATGPNLMITLTSELWGDLEELALQATAPGVFEGSIDTDPALQMVPGNGVLEVGENEGPPHEFDTVLASYDDVHGDTVTTARAAFTGSRVWFIDSYGAVTDSYPSGARVFVRVEEHRQTNPSQLDRLLVRVRSLDTGDLETLELVETTRTSNVYQGSLEHRAGPAAGGDGVIQAGMGTLIEAEREDPAGWSSTKTQARIDYAGVDFIDEQGLPTAMVLEGGTARVRVVRISDYDDPSQADTLGVEVESRFAGDREFLTLTETGPDTGIYEGAIALGLGAFEPDNGTLETSNSGAPEYRGDELTASYGPDYVATAVTVTSRVSFIDGFGREVTTFPLGGTVRVRVVELTAGNPAANDFLEVILQTAEGDTEPLMLEETGPDTHVFEGPMETVQGDAYSGDGTLQGRIGQAFVARRTSPTRPYPVEAHATFTGASLLFTDAAGQPASVYLEGSRVYLRLVAPLAGLPDVSVTLSADLSGDSESVLLNPTSPGVYEGSIDTVLSAGGIFGNDVLELGEASGPPHEFETLTASFAYGGTSATASAGFTGSRTWFIDAYGAVTDSYPTGSTAFVRVEDHNVDDPTQVDRLIVTVFAADTEELELVETGPATHIFEGSIPLANSSSANPGDGRLEAPPGTILFAQRTDVLGYSLSQAEARVTFGSLELIDEAGVPTLEILENGTARVRLFSVPGNSDPATAESVTADLRSLYAGDQEALTLTETGVNTSVFEGVIQLSTASTIQGNGTLETFNSGAPAYLGDEVTASYGPELTVTARTMPARISFYDLLGRKVSSYAAVRMPVRVRIEDHSRNTSAEADSFPVPIHSPETSDAETLTVIETGPATGVFEGEIPTSEDPSPYGSGVLHVVQSAELMHVLPYGPSLIARVTFQDNLSPYAGEDITEVLEGQSVVVPVLANDADAFNQTFTVVAVGQGGHGTAAINPDGTVTYTAGLGYDGPDSFTYIVEDNLGGQALGTVLVNVLSANEPPTPAYDQVVTAEDTEVVIQPLLNDTDPDDDALDIVSISVPATGTAVLNADDTVTYTPAPEFSGEVVFSYMVRDPEGAEAPSAVTVTVTPVNDAPEANDDAVTTNEDQSVIVNVVTNDGDIDSATWMIDSFTQGQQGTVVQNPEDGSLVYTPASEFIGTDTFTYTLRDDAGATDTATVTIVVEPVDDAPVAVNDSATVTEDDPATAINVLANDTDPDGGAMSIASVTQPANGTVVITGGGTGLTYQPNASYCNTPPGTTLDTFTYTLTPGGSAATVTVTVTCVDNDPTTVDDSATVAEDSGANAIDVLANDTDADGGPKSIASVTQPANGTVVITGGGTGLTYQPNASYCNTPPGTALDTFTYTLTPGGSTATVTVTVTCVDNDPTAVDDSATVAEDSGATAINVLANDTDPDGGAMSIASVTQPANGTVVITGGGTGLTYQPNASYCNTPPGTALDTFTYTLTPGGSTATVTVSVTCVDDDPVAVADAATVAEDSGANAIDVLTNDTDPDSGPISISSVTQPANGTVVITGGGTGLTYQPNASYCNTPPGTTLETFTYTLTPGGSTATVTVSVTCEDDSPVAVADTATVTEDASATVINVLANDTDTDGGAMSISSVTQPANGTAVITGGGTGLTYQPNAGYCNTPPGTTLDTFTYTLTPGGSAATVTVSVTCVDDDPVAVADAATVTEDAAATAVDVLANDTDADGGAMSIASVTQPANGTVVITGGGTGLTYQPNAGYCNTPPGTTLDTFTYTLTPGGSTATVSVTVSCVNDAPVAMDDAAAVAEDGSVIIPVEANDSDPESDPLDVTAVTQGANGAVVLNADDTVTYTPSANFSGSDSFTYTVSDGNGGTDTATVMVTVTPVNDPPVAMNDAAATLEDQPVTVAVRSNDSDLDNDALTIISVTQGTQGTVTINAGQTVIYTPAANTSGADSFTYTISDGNGGTATASVSVSVAPVNDAPVAVDDTATTAWNQSVTVPVLVNDVDLDGPALTVTAVTSSPYGSVVINSGQTITFTPNVQFVGLATFNYTVSDGVGGTATAQVRVTVQKPGRVSSNVQVLYDFNEGAGNQVYDVSGVGTALNLTIANTANVTWVTGGLKVNAATTIQSAVDANKVINAVQSTNAITVEAWVAPTNLTQSGPARVLSIAQNSSKRDVMLGQDTNKWASALRTTTTGNAGGSIATPAGGAASGLNHVVFTRDAAGNVTLYVSGVVSASGTLGGNLGNWHGYKLGVGNEIGGGAPWLGELHLVAVYNRALTATEVTQNLLAGAN